MPTASELLVQKTQEAEQRKILEMAKECGTLEELIKRLKTMIDGN